MILISIKVSTTKKTPASSLLHRRISTTDIGRLLSKKIEIFAKNVIIVAYKMDKTRNLLSFFPSKYYYYLCNNCKEVCYFSMIFKNPDKQHSLKLIMKSQHGELINHEKSIKFPCLHVKNYKSCKKISFIVRGVRLKIH